MYSFPHPQAIFDGGGIYKPLIVFNTLTSGTTRHEDLYVVPNNRVAHILYACAGTTRFGTSSYNTISLYVADLSNNYVGFILYGVIMNSAQAIPFFISASPNIILPPGYKLRYYMRNLSGANEEMMISVHLIEYEIFRS